MAEHEFRHDAQYVIVVTEEVPYVPLSTSWCVAHNRDKAKSGAPIPSHCTYQQDILTPHGTKRAQGPRIRRCPLWVTSLQSAELWGAW